MKIQYSLPIIKANKTDILKTINTNKDVYDFFEVWLDYIDDLDEAFLKNLAKDLGEKLIVVFRRQNFEKQHIDFDKRLKCISILRNSQSLIDLDIEKQEKELNHIKTNALGTRTIISYHNYQETPDDSILRKIVDTMNTYSPTILKIATMCNNKRDAIRLLELTLELKERSKSCIVLGMGEFGSITRIFGTLWGNEMIFAPKVITERSAIGQLTKHQLETIFKQLEG